jgi:peroxiredoxin
MANNNDQNNAPWVEDRMAALAPDADWNPNVARGLARLRRERAAARTRRRRSSLAAGTVAATLLLAATPMAQSFVHMCGQLVRNLTGHGPSRAYTAPRQRRMMPDFTLNDASGRPVRLSDFRGQVVLLNIWTTSCGQCQVEMPWFDEFQRTYRDRGLVVLGISLDTDGWTSVTPYVESKKIGYRVMVGNENFARTYATPGAVPTTLIIDKAGRIAVTHIGFCSKREYEADTQTLLAEH